jgi:hypothetical protein
LFPFFVFCPADAGMVRYLIGAALAAQIFLAAAIDANFHIDPDSLLRSRNRPRP